MKSGLYVAAALLLGALLAQLLLSDPGYVAVRFHGYLIEMSVPVLVLILATAYFVLRLLVHLWNARGSFALARRHRNEDRARRGLVRGLLELAEGNWSAAEQTLTRSAREGDVAAAHYLAAARAAELQGALERRDKWIARALEVAPDERAAALISQAEFELKHKQLEAALAALEQLEASGSQNPRGLVLLARVYRSLGRWEALEALEPRLRNLKSVPAATRDDIATQVCLERLQSAGAACDSTQLDAVWRRTPRSVSQRPEVVVAYARNAMLCGEHKDAEKSLRTLLARQWDEGAVLAYGDLESAEPLETLDTAEGWLRDHPEDPSLLLTCAKLCMRAELYGKARSYLEASLAIRPRLEAYQLLATLMEHLGDRERAIKALNDALIQAVGRHPSIPKIRRRTFPERRRGNDRRHGS